MSQYSNEEFKSNLIGIKKKKTQFDPRGNYQMDTTTSDKRAQLPQHVAYRQVYASGNE